MPIKPNRPTRDPRTNPYHCHPATPRFNRRAFFHDYSAPSRYMITLLRSDGLPSLSVVRGNPKVLEPSHPDFPRAYPTPAGECFVEAVKEWAAHYSGFIRIDEFVVMPDHVHICLKVIRSFVGRTDLSLAIAMLMGRCTRHYRDLLIMNQSNVSVIEKIRFFRKGFNDTIAFDEDQFKVKINYVIDNPRRLLVKRKYRDLFFTRNVITIDGDEYDAFGNIYLLRRSWKEMVKFSSKAGMAANERNYQKWESCVAAGGVLVSPFIHEYEKKARDMAVAEGGLLIRICENGFPERFAPQGQEFELISEGRLLLIGPKVFVGEKEPLTRERCVELNRLSSLVVSQPEWLTMGLRPGGE